LIKGYVYLVGAGPGDPKLITIKGSECIAKADVLVYDRLVSRRLLMLARPECELIYVGKSPDRHTLRQEEINQLLVAKGLEGKIVTRLKGGDPFVFGRGGEEAEALVEAGVQFEVVPGISSAIAVPAFLQGIRRLTEEYGALLIFDEVMTGFRVSYGGAQGFYGIDPDLTCLGKVIGGGLPVGAYGGKRRFMEQIAPSGPIYQAGTLSGNPLAMNAGLITIKLLQQPGTYEVLAGMTTRLAEGLKQLALEAGLAIWVNAIGAMFSAFFTDVPVKDYTGACTSDVERFAKYYRGMLERGIYLAPSQYEAVFYQRHIRKQTLTKRWNRLEWS